MANSQRSGTGTLMWAVLLMLGAGLVAPGLVQADPFMVVALPDTQNYSQSYPATYTAQTQWIVDNAASQNIQFVTHLGDIVQTWNSSSQWANAKTSMNILDANDVPYGTVMGNHDGRSTYPNYYLDNFGPQHYQGEGWWGGASPTGLSNYQTISAGGKDFLFLHVQIDTPQVELDWAQTVLDQHPDKLVVFSTHRYLNDFRVMQGRYTDYDYPGFDDYYEPNWVMSEDLFQDFVRTHKNIFMVLCGHCAGQYHQVSENDWGLPVYEILQDFDSFTPNGGDGWMRLFTFDVDANQVQVQMYSPTLGRFRQDGPKETHEDFQATLAIMQYPEVVAAIGSFLQREDPNLDPNAFLEWLMENDAQNFWDLSYADGQRDSSFTIPVDFDAYVTPDPDPFTELFDLYDNDLGNFAITFTPDGSADYYAACATSISSLPTDPSGGTPITLGDDDFQQVILADANVSLYNANDPNHVYGDFYVSSNGYITFTAGDDEFDESLANHFDLPRISALFDDLDPSSGGSISWRQLGDRVAVTFEDVPEYGTGTTNTFQIEMFFDGRIRISWLMVEAMDGLAGLSEGNGVPFGFVESDLTAYGLCAGPPTASAVSASTPINTPVGITLVATDDGEPNALSYIITSLPDHGDLSDPNAGSIGAAPYTLVEGGDVVDYTPDPAYTGPDAFDFKANDGGTPPEGGDSNEATVSISVYVDELDSPNLHPEPNATTGYANTIEWDAVDGAASYYAECAEDANFATLFGNSGTIGDIHYEFTGLASGQTYWYRVKAMTSPAAGTTDTVGGTSLTKTYSPRMKGNFFHCTADRTLNQIEQYLTCGASQSLQFAVYESDSQLGTYSQIHLNAVTSGTGTGWYGSGAISVPLVAGKYYCIGVAWALPATYYYNAIGSEAIGWGTKISAMSTIGYPAPSSVDYANSSLGFYQRLTTTDESTYVESDWSNVESSKQSVYYHLEITERHKTYGEVLVDPEPNDLKDIWFEEGTSVTLTAVPRGVKKLKEWWIYDPNFLDDANYADKDTNTVTTFVMESDRHVKAVWKCGGGGAGLPLLVVGAALCTLASHRRRRRG